jgi:hypothetical protein
MVQGWANGDYFELLLLQGPEDRKERIIFSQTLTAR